MFAFFFTIIICILVLLVAKLYQTPLIKASNGVFFLCQVVCLLLYILRSMPQNLYQVSVLPSFH